MSYVVNPNDPTSPKDTDGATQGAQEFRGIKGLIQTLVAGLFIANPVNTNPYGLVNLLNPSGTDQGRGIVASGWDFAGRNQQWGGAPAWFELVDSATDQLFKFEAADGYIEQTSAKLVGQAAANMLQAQVITPAKNMSLQAFWLKLYKVANPVDQISVQLWTVAAGVPGVLIATANPISGKQITSDQSGQWYRFSFAAVQALVAGTQYFIVAQKSTASDGTNYYQWVCKTATAHYPNNLSAFGTTVPAWTADNTQPLVFLVEPQASDQVLQSGGVFDWQLCGYASNPLNRMGALNCSLQNLKWNYRKGTVLIRGNSFGKGFPFFDATYGLHHDRLVAITNPITGVGTLTLLDRNGVATTISGVTDLSTATHKDISLEYRSMNDGGDYLRLRINGIVEAQVITQSFNMDPLWILGTAWLMGGFQLMTTASYNQLLDMTVLPSAAAPAWTYTGAGGEGAAFNVLNSKLYQVANGITGANIATYSKNALGFNNANGSTVIGKIKVSSAGNIKDANYAEIDIYDGTKRLVLETQEYFYSSAPLGLNYYKQNDVKSAENVFNALLKGNDYYIFYNGALGIEGTGGLNIASGLNQIIFGDSAASGSHADTITDYIGYVTSFLGSPQFSSCKISQFAYFQEDASAIMGNLYNSGLPISVKSYNGVEKNWIGEAISQKFSLRGITSNPTTTSTAPVIQPEQELFIVGSLINVESITNHQNSGLNNDFFDTLIDGNSSNDHWANQISSAGNGYSTTALKRNIRTYFGLHKIEAGMFTSAGTLTLQSQQRRLSVEAQP